MLSLRPLNLETDAPQYAELLSTAMPEPATVERVYEWERNFPLGGVRRRTVAVDEHGLILGANNSSHWPHMLPDTFAIEVVVLPQYRRRGIGARLYADAVDFASAHHAARLTCEVRDENPAWLAFVESRGFRIERHIFESTLDLLTFDESRFPGIIESVQAQGIRFASLAEVGNTEANRLKLHDVNRRTVLDIPGSDGTFLDFEDFEKIVVQASWFRPDGQILAILGERYIGLGAIGYYVATNSAYNLFTGVVAEFRGRRIALALKLLGARFARSLGAGYIRTNNDSQNAPMLAINLKLGYQSTPGYFKVVRDLTR